MAEPLLASQLAAPPQPQGNRSARHVPHGAYRCLGDDAWIGIAVGTDAEWKGLCELVPALAPLSGLGSAERTERRQAVDQLISGWARSKPADAAAEELLRAGIPAAALATSCDLVDCPHLRDRGFWDAHGAGVLPGLPWHATFGRKSGPAPALGTDTEDVLRDVLELSPAEVTALRQSGAIG
jgi:crotonobetainyl-CoA:carnitine CoA-transferase CaiB-like acyl-CoA transferase